MKDKHGNNKRIVNNTLLLYFRMLFNLLITLYTSRLILKYLGVRDYGIYNIVGGLVSMFSLISGSLSNSVSRFISFELGKENLSKLKKIFSVSVTIHLLLALIIVFFVELIGVWFLNNKMQISNERLFAANWILQFSLLTFVFNLINIPYNAVVQAYERMNFFAFLGIFETISKLAIVLFLSIYQYDKLIMYGLSMLVLSIIIVFISFRYCRKNFRECDSYLGWDKAIFSEISKFASWNFLESMANIFKSQGVSIVLNMFFGTLVNAAQGVAGQVNNAVQLFASNFMAAVNPQIMKSYASGDKDTSVKLVAVSSRMSFYLVLIISFPILCNTDYILKLWLTDIPVHTASFIRLVLIYTLIEVLIKPLYPLVDATGNIKAFRIGISILLFLNLPLSYFFLWMGYPPVAIYFVLVFIEFISLFFRFYTASKVADIDLLVLYKEIFIRVLLIATFAVLIGFFVINFIKVKGFLMLGVSCFSSLLLIVAILVFGLKKTEKGLLYEMFKNKLRKK